MFASLLLILVGIILIAESVFLPKLIQRSRNSEKLSRLLGDRYTRVMYFAIGCICTIWGVMQILN